MVEVMFSLLKLELFIKLKMQAFASQPVLVKVSRFSLCGALTGTFYGAFTGFKTKKNFRIPMGSSDGEMMSHR